MASALIKKEAGNQAVVKTVSEITFVFSVNAKQRIASVLLELLERQFPIGRARSIARLVY